MNLVRERGRIICCGGGEDIEDMIWGSEGSGKRVSWVSSRLVDPEWWEDWVSPSARDFLEGSLAP